MITTFNSSYTVRVQGAGSYDDDSGNYAPGSETPTPIEATIMRLSDKDRLLLPEEQRTIETLKVYTSSSLNIGKNADSTEGDILEYKENDYRITSLQNWEDFNQNGLEYFYYRATRIDPKPNRKETP